MKVYVDSEFFQAEGRIHLVSLAMVTEKGAQFYRQSCDWEPPQAPDWVQQHVFPHLEQCPQIGYQEPFHPDGIRPHLSHTRACNQFKACPWRSRPELRRDVETFLLQQGAYQAPQFVGSWCGFDFVLFSQLYGAFEQWPEEWPFYFLDMQQYAYHLALKPPDVPVEREHHALDDCLAIKQQWEWLERQEAYQNT